MRIGIVGSGGVARTLGGKLIGLDHDVRFGTREPGKLGEWLTSQRGGAAGSVAEAARHGEIVLNATAGTASVAALKSAGESSFDGKILIDVANPLEFSKGMPPTLTILNTDSLGEQIQRTFPKARVVKTLNTVNMEVMIAPQAVAGGEHQLFVCGNDAGAKSQVTEWLKSWFGWKHVLDLGDITGARATEMYLPIWLRLMGVLGTAKFNLRIVQ